MKLIPKFQGGGNPYSNFFVTYTPVLYSAPKELAQAAAATRQKKEKDGGIEVSDFLNLIKDAKGLPNELYLIVKQMATLLGRGDLSLIPESTLTLLWLSIFYLIKVAENNKDKYDSSYKAIELINGFDDPAIDLSGRLIVQNRKTGKLTRMDMLTYINNKNDYAVMSMYSLSLARSRGSGFVNNDEIIAIMNNTMSRDKFLKIVDNAVGVLGLTETSREGTAFLGIKNDLVVGYGAMFDGLSREAIEALQNGVSIEGLYEYKLIEKNKKELMEAALYYILSTFPENAKTWAAYNTGVTDGNLALLKLVTGYLLSKAGITTDYKLKPASTEYFSGGGAGGGSSRSGSEPKEGKLVSFLKERGETTMSTIKLGRTNITFSSHYTQDIGINLNSMTLRAFTTTTDAKGIIKNSQLITFGDLKIDDQSYADIVIDFLNGVISATLPKNPDGTVNLSIANKVEKIKRQAKEFGYNETSPAYKKLFENEVKKDNSQYGLSHYYNEDGTPKLNNFGFFMILKAYATEDTKFEKRSSDDNKLKIGDRYDFNDSYFDKEQEVSDNLKKELGKTLGLDEGEEYDNDLYSGNLFIPIDPDLIKAHLADGNQITTSLADELNRLYLLKMVLWNSDNQL